MVKIYKNQNVQNAVFYQTRCGKLFANTIKTKENFACLMVKCLFKKKVSLGISGHSDVDFDIVQ